MGGHGGLNILPQKEWNVYNWDNRITVEKDKRLAREKQEEEDRQRQRSGAQARIDRIKYNNKNNLHKQKIKLPSSSRSRSRSDSKDKQSKLTQELKDMNKSKHYNLFEEEQQQIELQENNKALMEREQEYFKELPYDSTSKFLGTISTSKPWYMKSKDMTEEEKTQTKKFKEQIDQFKKQDDSYYQILKLDKKVEEKTLIKEKNERQGKEEFMVKEEKREKKNKKDKKDKKKLSTEEKLEKLAAKLKKLLGKETSEKIRQKEQVRARELLRSQRLAREKGERQREQKLISQVYTFDFQKK